MIHHRNVPWSPGRVFAVGEVSGDAKFSFDFQTSNTGIAKRKVPEVNLGGVQTPK